MRVVVALSGGVDSATVAWLMSNAGHDVVGITMQVWSGTGEDIPPGRSCFGPVIPGEENSAQNVARWLGIEHKIVSLESEFAHEVFQYYRAEYQGGRTPVPCISCNQRVKFGALINAAQETFGDFDRFVTGHYARIGSTGEGGPLRLMQAKDLTKDQTYFLYRIDPLLLPRLSFPVGDYTKDEIRTIARDAQIPVHDRPESKGFYSGDYRDLLHFPARKGEVVSLDGRTLGEHQGYWNFTIGQRKGLELPGEQRIWFVVSTDPETNTVYVGKKESLYKTGILVDSLIWPPHYTGSELRVQVRAGNTHPLISAKVVRTGEEEAQVWFEEPVIAMAPGQSAVFYEDRFVLGGGVIRKVL